MRIRLGFFGFIVLGICAIYLWLAVIFLLAASVIVLGVIQGIKWLDHAPDRQLARVNARRAAELSDKTFTEYDSS